jgi:hypothetical protein
VFKSLKPLLNAAFTPAAKYRIMWQSAAAVHAVATPLAAFWFTSGPVPTDNEPGPRGVLDTDTGVDTDAWANTDGETVSTDNTDSAIKKQQSFS